jgi:hypothetical protein
MTNTPKKQSITEIDKLLHFCIEWKGEDKRYEDELIKDTKQSLKQLILTEIIGRDEDDIYYARRADGTYPRELGVKAQNALREEQRKRVEELFEGNDK